MFVHRFECQITSCDGGKHFWGTTNTCQKQICLDKLRSKAEKWKIKPLIHLLDSAQEHKINLIQSACITLCNMASKPQLHQHFIHEPEISTIKNCLANPIDKDKGNELIRFMIKLVCNLTKNQEILGDLSKKGFLEILFELLNHEKEKEIFGNVVTAISYLSVQKDCQEKIIKNKDLSLNEEKLPEKQMESRSAAKKLSGT